MNYYILNSQFNSLKSTLSVVVVDAFEKINTHKIMDKASSLIACLVLTCA